MSLNLIKKNSSSPFHLQRSIVSQGDEDGAYAKGGYNPQAVYNNDAANAAMESFSKTMGAALSNMDFGNGKKEDKGLNEFKDITEKAKISDELEKKKNQEDNLNRIAEDFDQADDYGTANAFSSYYKKRRPI